MKIQVQLPTGRTLEISEVEIFSDPSVGIMEHIDNYKAVDIATQQEITDWGTELTTEEQKVIDDAIWKEYYKIEEELQAKYERAYVQDDEESVYDMRF